MIYSVSSDRPHFSITLELLVIFPIVHYTEGLTFEVTEMITGPYYMDYQSAMFALVVTLLR